MDKYQVWLTKDQIFFDFFSALFPNWKTDFQFLSLIQNISKIIFQIFPKVLLLITAAIVHLVQHLWWNHTLIPFQRKGKVPRLAKLLSLKYQKNTLWKVYYLIFLRLHWSQTQQLAFSHRKIVPWYMCGMASVSWIAMSLPPILYFIRQYHQQ